MNSLSTVKGWASSEVPIKAFRAISKAPYTLPYAVDNSSLVFSVASFACYLSLVPEVLINSEASCAFSFIWRVASSIKAFVASDVTCALYFTKLVALSSKVFGESSSGEL